MNRRSWYTGCIFRINRWGALQPAAAGCKTSEPGYWDAVKTCHHTFLVIVVLIIVVIVIIIIIASTITIGIAIVTIAMIIATIITTSSRSNLGLTFGICIDRHLAFTHVDVLIVVYFVAPIVSAGERPSRLEGTRLRDGRRCVQIVHIPKDGRSTTRNRGKAATSTCIWMTHRHSLPWAFQTMGRTAPNPFWTTAVERCAIRWNPAQHRPHYPACRPPTSACGSKSKLHALASCCGLRVRGLHHDRRPARARRRQNSRGLSLL